MKKFQRLLVILLVLTMQIGLFTPLQAVQGYANFSQKNSYAGFKDVAESSWYLKSVQTVYEYNLMKGSGPGIFNPQGNLTIAEAITLAVRLYESFHGQPQTQASTQGAWYQSYLNKAISIGLVGRGFFSHYTVPIMRSEFTDIFSRVFPFQQEQPKNSITLNHLPDVDSGTISYDRVLMLYNLGIITGDKSLRFFPRSSITRAEVATIVSRMILPEQRVAITKTVSPIREEKHLNRDYSWFIDQYNTGTHKVTNCGPCVAAMSMKWFDPALNATAEKLRSETKPNGDPWSTGDIQRTLKKYKVPYEAKQMSNISDLVNEIKNGRLVLVCIDAYDLSEIYPQPDTGHFILLKGYTMQEDGTIRFEAYNPAAPKDSIYHAKNIADAMSNWWLEYYSIGK